MRFRPKRIRIRPLGADGVGTGEQWRVVGVLTAAEDMRLQEAMPDDTARVFDLAGEHTVSVTWHGVDPAVVRVLFNIPDGFPLWYRTPRRALPAPPVREALPWGDSCYTSAVFAKDADGWPRANWCLGPVPGLTPSSEGPRRREAAEAVIVERMLAKIRERRRR